jgi:ABC-type transporter Mla maintaining outer membrane lipid asymmetry permease subunit MlaE
LAAGVRQGLLETLALARWPIENYALLPAVAAQVVAMTVATAVCLAAGVVAASLVYTLGHARAPLPLSVDLLLSGLRNAPGWEWYLAAKVLSSGLLAGTIAAWCGGTPGSARDDVAEAVHRTLLWGVLCVIACQCVWIIAEFANQP